MEAYRARKAMNNNSDLMIMNMIDKNDLKWAIENNISYFVFDFERLEKSIEIAKQVSKQAKIHIEVETGFNRTGFKEHEIDKVITEYNNNREYLHIEGLCTHYAGAESIANYYRIREQISKFNRIKEIIHQNNVYPKHFHSACSAAALTYEDTLMNMVRIGISQYGFWPSSETKIYNMLSDNAHFTKDPLHRILSWKSKIISINNIKAGEFIGYGNSYLTSENTKIAIVPVGYYHGFSRSLSNLGYVLINNRKAPVVGMINMNMSIINITGINNASIGDEVVIIGKQGRHEISVSSFSDMANYVNYEMLVRLPYEIPRIIVDNEKYYNNNHVN